MCVINFKINNDPNYILAIAANRDESYNRPAYPARIHGNILHGTDAHRGGTWLGITKTGRIAMITNIRNVEEMTKKSPLSRGDIVLDFLRSESDAKSFLAQLRTESSKYGGFNVILGDLDSLYYMNNYDNQIEILSENTHGVSNAFLNTPWAKVQHGKHTLDRLSGDIEEDKATLLRLLSSSKKTHSHRQNTGIDKALEYALSSQFIELQDMEYGTRCSTVILITHDGFAHFLERTYTRGTFDFDTEFKFKIGEA
ncbi:NRDE family protein [Phocicoccus pinnipedialis]|uniref:Transport and Golgi organization 2 n=1 Tax=Phocicoccus pinnipedialis TaxID=110845 RepID=A0A6V7R8T5_9BACL|nr:NRDE family protein [Jeotgalicoccus pinnipedialis]MBP1940155.1 uncharacterized protein with NRDE domain [Jeotgalicoccus pinnipedialis]CAD2073771.1 hypothetical protein JEOPIN946_00736 [Jeotgalicoccus pinnipedialis]